MANTTISEWHYSVYGLHLVSNRSIPLLMPNTDQACPEQIVQINFNEQKKPAPLDTTRQQIYISPGIAHNGEPFFQVCKSDNPHQHLIIQYTDGDGVAQFFLNQNGTAVDVVWDKIPFADILTYFRGPVLGCLLRLRQQTCLHAGVVAVGNSAIAIIGTKSAGKSTTTAALACYQKLPVLSDDIAVISKIRDQYVVQPGYPCLRLWPATIDCLPGLEAKELPRILSIADKRYLELSTDNSETQWRFQQQPLPLKAIYLLDTREAESFSLEALTGGASLFALAANVYPEYTLEAAMRMNDFEFLGKLTDSIPVRKVYRSDNLELLLSICQAIFDDVQ